MKKTIIIASAMLFAVSGAQAQFLSKMLDKAADKVVNKVTGKSSASSNQKVDPIFLDPYYGSKENDRELFYPDGDVPAASASDLNSLLAKIPAVPSGSEILLPTKGTMLSFVRSLEAVGNRAIQLSLASEESDNNRAAAAMQAQQKAAQKAQQQAMARAEQTQAYAAEAMKVYEGMSPEELNRIMELGQKLENMSDKQAEAYMKAHPEDMALMQKYAGKMMQLNAHRPTQQVDKSAFVNADTEIYEDKARSLLASVPTFDKFAEKEAAKLEDEYSRILENGGNAQSLLAKVKDYRVYITNAWSKYLTDLAANVKKELLEQAKAPNCPMSDIYDDVDNLCNLLRTSTYPDNLLVAAPVFCQREVTRQLKLNDAEYLVRPENFLGLNELVLYKRNRETGNLFRFNAGKWTRMSDDFVLDYERKVEPMENQIITSADGKQQAVVSGTAGFIRLPEGSVAYPVAVEITGNTIHWYDFKVIDPETPGEMVTWQIVECVRKI